MKETYQQEKNFPLYSLSFEKQLPGIPRKVRWNLKEEGQREKDANKRRRIRDRYQGVSHVPFHEFRPLGERREQKRSGRN